MLYDYNAVVSDFTGEFRVLGSVQAIDLDQAALTATQHLNAQFAGDGDYAIERIQIVNVQNEGKE